MVQAHRITSGDGYIKQSNLMPFSFYLDRTFILPRGGSKNPQGLDKEERLDRGMEFGQRVSTPVIISLVFAVVVVLLGTVTIILITKRRGSNNRNSRRRSSQRGLSHRNPALDDTSSAPGG